jgi:hypothetical protein
MTSDASTEAAVLPRKKLGTIVIGPKVLRNLCFDISDHYRKDERPPSLFDASRPPQWIDILPALAKAGFEVEIPEIVALANAQMTADGFCFYDHMVDPFAKMGNSWLSEPRFADRASALTDNPAFGNTNTIPFLKAVAAGKFPHMRIVPPAADDDSDAAKYVREIHKAAEQVKTGDKDGAMATIDSANEAVKQANQNAKKRKVEGSRGEDSKGIMDKAAIAWAKQLPKDDKLVIALANDGSFCQSIDEVRRANENQGVLTFMNTQALIRRCCVSELLGQMNVKNYEGDGIDHILKLLNNHLGSAFKIPPGTDPATYQMNIESFSMATMKKFVEISLEPPPSNEYHELKKDGPCADAFFDAAALLRQMAPPAAPPSSWAEREGGGRRATDRTTGEGRALP